jgi:hypothetical protein
MTSKDFTNWLRGYIAGNDEMSTKVKNDITKALDNVDDGTVKQSVFTYRTGTSGTDFVNTTSNIKA